MKSNILSTLSILTIASSGISQAAITVVNGDFQTQIVADNSWAATSVDVITGWTFTGNTTGNVNILADGDPAAPADTGKAAGDQYAVFNESGAAANGTIFQTISGLDIAQEYEVSFEVIRLFTGTDNTPTMAGTFASGGSTLGSGSGSDTTNGDGGTVATFRFTATEATGVLTFTDNSGGSAGIDTGLDNITITAVPEPSSTALLGLAGFTLLLRKRR
ncbi:MAG: PEP-CTERM sorting domain-containing protein [Akkermansiaceae bacterium]